MKSFNPERDLFTPTAEKLAEAEEALYAILVPKNERRAISIDDFTDLYGPEVVAKDKLYIANLEENFKHDGKREASLKGGKLLEAVMYDGILDINFMGPNAKPIVPSRYDDIVNGIDSIIEFEGEKGTTSHVALGIDVTKNKTDISKKFERVKTSIDRGTLSTAKYFESGNFRGELRLVVRVIVGADQKAMESISHLMLRAIRMKNTIAENRKTQNNSDASKELPKEFAKNRTALAEHPLQWIVLLEMKEQLEAFQKRAHKFNQERIVEECAKILHIINEVILEKNEEMKVSGREIDQETIRRDEVFKLIREQIATF